MSSITIRKIGITDLDTDAIVNAANEGLWPAGASAVLDDHILKTGNDMLNRAWSFVNEMY